MLWVSCTSHKSLLYIDLLNTYSVPGTVFDILCYPIASKNHFILMETWGGGSVTSGRTLIQSYIRWLWILMCDYKTCAELTMQCYHLIIGSDSDRINEVAKIRAPGKDCSDPPCRRRKSVFLLLL